MKVVALCKTFDSEEWVELMISALYYYVDRIVFVHSEVSWDGRIGNTVRQRVADWAMRYDGQRKIINVDFDSGVQQDQYEAGMRYMRKYLDYDYMMIIDCDEIWTPEMLERSLRHLESGASCYACKMKTYLKSPFYQVDPPEPASPVVFIRKDQRMIGVRGNQTEGKIVMDDVYFHHYTLVRDKLETIRAKVQASNVADGNEVVNVDEWISGKWEMLPMAHDFHVTKGYEHYWGGVRIISKQEAPDILFSHPYPIVLKYEMSSREHFETMPSGFLLPEDEKLIKRYARGRFVDIGTFKGRSAWIASETADEVHTVDIFEDVHLIENETYREFYRAIFEKHNHRYGDVARHLSVHENIEVTKGLSRSIDVANVSCVFIDGDHSFDGVAADYEYWLPRVVIGGYVMFHDVLAAEDAPEFEQQVNLFVNKVVRHDERVSLVDGCGRTSVWKREG